MEDDRIYQNIAALVLREAFQTLEAPPQKPASRPFQPLPDGVWLPAYSLLFWENQRNSKRNVAIFVELRVNRPDFTRLSAA